MSNDFPQIGVPPERPYDAIHRFYLQLEPLILAAFERGDRREARRHINHLLVHIYSLGENRDDLLKGFLLELVVMLSRRAVERGASQAGLFGEGFSRLAALAAVRDEEELSAWLADMMERLFGEFERGLARPRSETAGRAIRLIKERLGGALTRDEVARACGVSPGHLSELLKEATGRPFAALLKELRVERACALLADPRWQLADVAAEAGFCDQSHLTNVFRELRGTTPRAYREELFRRRRAHASGESSS